MKTKLLILLFLNFLISTYCQTPEKIAYQAIIRNASDQLITNQDVGIQISILKSSANGDAVFVESHQPTTNSYGLVSLNIGEGSSTLGSFSSIDWGANSYFVKIEVDLQGSSNYTLSNTSELLSAPYALYAKTSGSSLPGPKGDKGDKGDIGLQGIQGIQGAQGDQGLQGDKGEKGDKGDKGDVGLQGIQGLKGDKGDQGIQGIQGDQGEKGDKGDKGNVGLQGISGLKGDRGDQGIQGVQGDKGEKGDKGIQGENGEKGDKGDGANQNLSINNTTITISDGNSIDLLPVIKSGETDNSITNEIELPEGGNQGDVLETDGAGNYKWIKVLKSDEDVSINGKLEIDGAATNKQAYNAGSSAEIDFTKSNLAYTASDPTAFTLEGIKDGGTYTLAVQGSASAEASFTATGFTFKSKNNSTTLEDTHTLYTFLVMGTTVYFSMITGL